MNDNICQRCSRTFQRYFENQRFCLHCSLILKQQKQKQEVIQGNKEIEEPKIISSSFSTSFEPFLENVTLKPKTEEHKLVQEIHEEPIKEIEKNEQSSSIKQPTTQLETPRIKKYASYDENVIIVSITIPISLYKKLQIYSNKSRKIVEILKQYFENSKNEN